MQSGMSWVMSGSGALFDETDGCVVLMYGFGIGVFVSSHPQSSHPLPPIP